MKEKNVAKIKLSRGCVMPGMKENFSRLVWKGPQKKSEDS